MKCASATAGIASVVTGLAVVLSSAPAHATFMYLNQSQLISAAISASSVASSSGESAATNLEARYGDEEVVPVAQTEGSDAEHANAEMVYAGLQQPLTGVYSNDASSGNRASYSAPSSGSRWTSLRSAARADSALPRYRADSNAPRQSSTGLTSPAKDVPAGAGSVTTPSAPVTSPPVSDVGTPTPPSTSVPNETGAPPVHSTPIPSPPTVETPIVGVPSTSVPEPSTVGLLGIGLLLVFVGLARGKRARYYSKVSASPRSAREMGSLAQPESGQLG